MIISRCIEWVIEKLEIWHYKTTRWNKSSNIEIKDTFDILNVESSNRFVTSSGQIYHNCLGVSYLMTAVGLSAKLSADTGKFVSEDKAQELIDLFYESYPDFAQWQNDTIKKYMEYKEYLSTPCGWKLFPDNDNFRSAANFPIQGFGASILRKAVELCEERGLEVILTLHDALYIEYDSFDFKAIDTFYDCMKEAFIFYFKDKKSASAIRLDGYTWSPDYEVDSEILTPMGKKIGCSNIYCDERAIEEYEQFSKYFENNGVNEI